MKNNNHGFSLIETVVAMAILGAFSVSVCTCLVMSLRMNDKSSRLMQEQMAVSSVVEELMATGIDPTVITIGSEYPAANGSLVTVTAVDDKNYYDVTVRNGEVTVNTQIREAVS